MTPAGHNRTLGLLHLLYGVFCIALMIVLIGFVSGAIDALAVRRASGEAIPVATFAFLIVGSVVVSLVLVTPSFVTGYALLKRKQWARKIGILSGVLAGLTFPFGTALCVYTLWFMFGEKGKFLYHKAAYALPAAPRERKTIKKLIRAQEPYVPPPTPPDWR